MYKHENIWACTMYTKKNHDGQIVIQKTYCFCNNLCVAWDINCEIKKHPCPFVTAQIICKVWYSRLLISGGFHPGFSTINRYIYSFNSTSTSWCSISTDFNLQNILVAEVQGHLNKTQHVEESRCTSWLVVHKQNPCGKTSRTGKLFASRKDTMRIMKQWNIPREKFKTWSHEP